MKQAKRPFQFMAASYLILIRRERAKTLGDLARFMRACSDPSIFYHTFQSLETHHYSAFSSDFAQWVLAACNDAPLAERLASVDLRDFVSLDDLRKRLVTTVEEHLASFPASADRLAYEPFHFVEAVEVALPVPTQAYTLGDLAAGIGRVSRQTLHYHFINSRLRLKLRTNDFSFWIEHSLGLPHLAQRINRIDFYTNTLEGLRTELIAAITSGEETHP